MGTGFHRAAAGIARCHRGPSAPAAVSRMGPRTEKIAKHATVTAAAAISPIDRFRTDFCTEPSWETFPQPSQGHRYAYRALSDTMLPYLVSTLSITTSPEGVRPVFGGGFGRHFSGGSGKRELLGACRWLQRIRKTIGNKIWGPKRDFPGFRVWGPLAATRSRMKTVSHAWHSAVCILPMIAATVFRPHPRKPLETLIVLFAHVVRAVAAHLVVGIGCPGVRARQREARERQMNRHPCTRSPR